MNKKRFRILLPVFFVGISLLLVFSGKNLLDRMRYYVLQNGMDNVASVMEQIQQTYEVQSSAYYRQLQMVQNYLLKENSFSLQTAENQAFLDTWESSSNGKLIFLKENGKVITASGKESQINVPSSFLVELHNGHNAGTTVFQGSQQEASYLVAVPCPEYTIDGEVFTAMGALYKHSDIDALMKLNGYGGNAYLFLIEEDGTVSYTNQSEETYYRNYYLLKHLKKDVVMTDEQYLSLQTELSARSSDVTLLGQKGQQFYMGYAPIQTTNSMLICLVSKPAVDGSLIEYQNSMFRTVIIIASCLVLFAIVLLYVYSRTRVALQRAEFEEKERQLQAQTLKELEANNKKLAQAQAATAEALQAAEAASKAKTDFLSNMSHDIRTPMNAIIGLTTLMENEPGLSNKMHDYISKLETSGQHLLELINNVLDMNRIESGKTTLNVTNINLADQITQVETIIGAQANQKNQTFTIITSHLNHEYIIADPARLQQVLVNILSNSVKYTPKHGHILFEIEEFPHNAHYAKYKFVVQDDGIGMSEEFLQHIFDPFTRAENSTTNKVQGTGLGMAITKTVVDLMGGTIHVDSTLGKGSRFEVTLVFPIDTEADQNVQHLSVLLVHCTNEERYQRVRDAVEGKPVHLHRTRTQAEACVTLRQANFDVVLMPLDTAESDVEQMRKLASPDTILLGAARSQNVPNVAANGLDGVLPYPFFLSNLEAEVQRVQQTRKEADQPEDVSPLSGMRFLCAEDNEINAEILQMLLEAKGASCKVYHNGQEIVDAFASVQPGDYDMILMDVQMPVMDGLEATKLIRSGANPLGKTIPILAMTANAFLEDRQKSKEAGMDEHLSKPVDISALEQTVRQFRLIPPPRRKYD